MKKAFAIGLILLLAVSAVMVFVGHQTPAEAGSYGVYQNGSTHSTGAAITVSTGFIPSRVIISRLSSTAGNAAKEEWNSSMPSASGFILSDPTATTSLATYVTVSGVSPYSGSTTTSPGFTIGANTSVNPTSPADTVTWEAWQ